MQDLINTYRELLRDEWLSWAKDNNGNIVPGVFNQPIQAWWNGDREVISANQLPAIALDSESFTPDWSGFRIQEHEYNFDILCYIRRDDPDDSKTAIHEMARLVRMVVQDQSRWWVFSECMFDKQIFYDPQYLIDNFYLILQPYVDQISLDYTQDWDAAHTAFNGSAVSPPLAPTLREKDTYVAAYLKLFYEDPLTDAWATTEFTYIDESGESHITTPGDLITLARAERIVPARFMGDSRIKNINYGYVYKGAELLYGAQVSIYAKEQWPITNFGPK